jgi:DNA-binding transcriptional regulator YiaG
MQPKLIAELPFMSIIASHLDKDALLQHERSMLTGTQIRAARAILKWSTRDLADKAMIGIATVHRAEAVDDVPGMNARTLMKLKATFEQGGVVFLDGPYSGSGGPGVRLRD